MGFDRDDLRQGLALATARGLPSVVQKSRPFCLARAWKRDPETTWKRCSRTFLANIILWKLRLIHYPSIRNHEVPIRNCQYNVDSAVRKCNQEQLLCVCGPARHCPSKYISETGAPCPPAPYCPCLSRCAAFTASCDRVRPQSHRPAPHETSLRRLVGFKPSRGKLPALYWPNLRAKR